MAKEATRVGGNISVRGSVTNSAMVTGKGNTTTLNQMSNEKEGPAVVSALTEIRAEMQRLSGPRAGTAQREIHAAVEEAASDKADKNVVGGALQGALEAARATADFTGAAAKLAPHVATVAHWLGGEWTSLLALLR